MRISQFLLLAMTTSLATYWMNASIIDGQFFWAGLYAYVVIRNLCFSYKVTKFIRIVELSTRK